MYGHSTTSTQWKVVRHIPDLTATATTAASTLDTLISDHKEANYNTNISFATDGYPGLLLRAFSKNAADQTARVVISGWMTDDGYGKNSLGPGQRLFEGEMRAGATTNSAIPELGPAATWQEVEDWSNDADLHGDVVGGANVGCRLIGGVGDLGQAMLLVPAAGYTRLMVEVATGSNDMTELGILGRLVNESLMNSLEIPGQPFIETEVGKATGSATIAFGADEIYTFSAPRRLAWVEILSGATATPLFGRWNQSTASPTSFEFQLGSAAVGEGRRVYSPENVRITTVTLHNGHGATAATYDTDFVVAGMV